jgi:hypothetical protein
MATSKDKPTRVTLFNQSGAPVVCSDEGHVLGAGERREVSTVDDAAQSAVDSGYLLVETPEPEPETAVADKAAPRSSGESTKDR